MKTKTIAELFATQGEWKAVILGETTHSGEPGGGHTQKEKAVLSPRKKMEDGGGAGEAYPPPNAKTRNR